MDPNVKLLLQRWLIDEPVLYRIICTHEICENKKMGCSVRCGEGKIEYNPSIIANMTYGVVNELFKTEALRIVLKHPYDRQPDCCNKRSCLIGSSLVLGDNDQFDNIDMPIPSSYGFDCGLSFEQYTYRVQDLEDAAILSSVTSLSDGMGFSNNGNGMFDEGEIFIEGSEKSFGKGKENESFDVKVSLTKDTRLQGLHKTNQQQNYIDQSELWREDPLMQCTVDNAIEEIKNSGCGWGSLSANIVEQILASTEAKIDYRKVLSGFRSTILSSKRHLTRMRPNRRSGFETMGSIRRYDTKLLVGVDVSGSVTSDSLRHFFSIIGRLFKYGIEKIDVAQFDCSITNVTSFEKVEKKIDIRGRGGTDFQPVVDYAATNQYDGLIIFTDGYAPEPNIINLGGCKLAWVCDSKRNFEVNSKWMKKQGRCCFVEA